MDITSIDSPTELPVVVASVDIRDFRGRCADMPDREVFTLLDRFYHLVDAAARQEGGMVVKVMGDAALLLFADSQAGATLKALRRIQRESRKLFDGDLDVVVARAHAGTVICGPIGPEKRFDVIGDQINRLFTLSGDGPEIFSEAFLAKLT